jgi:CheY-like chemotaxis protein
VLSNAIKFSEKASTIKVGLDWTISSTGERKNFDLISGRKVTLPRIGEIRISVIDTGAGLSEKQLETLFRSGVQFNVNQLQAGKGSGLGLYISKGEAIFLCAPFLVLFCLSLTRPASITKIIGIMEQHGGKLSAESKGLGQGATFTMSLPLYEKMTETETTEITRASDMAEPARWIKSLRFLVVDDSSFNRKFLARLLENNGHKVEQAGDGLVAVEKVRESIEMGCPFDTILLDYEVSNDVMLGRGDSICVCFACILTFNNLHCLVSVRVDVL